MRTSFAVRRMLFAVSCGALLTVGSAQAGQVVVTNTKDSLVGSLRQAVQDANAGDTIVFQIPTSDPGYDATNSTWTITLTSGQLSVSSSVTIDGGGRKITIRRSTAGGTPNFTVFFINASNVALTGLTIANGNAAGTPGGGGIVLQSGTLVMRNCTLTGNNGGPSGGGILNNPSTTLQVSNCTFTGNTSGGGGGIFSGGILEVNSSTIVGNSGDPFGSGGITNSGGTAHVRNTIIAGNSGDIGLQDVSGSFVSDGYNFIGIGSTMQGFGLPGSHDQVGVNGFPANPQLGPLQDNGGPTRTRAPSVGSPVIDQGSSGGLGSDQRGQPRPVDQPGVMNAGGGDASDIGAVEAGLTQPGPTFTVTNTSAHDDTVCSVDDCTLAEALRAANAAADANTINFAAGVSGEIQAGYSISQPVTVNGPGARTLTINGTGGYNGFYVQGTGNVTISGLTIANCAPPGSNSGGAILKTGTGQLTLLDCDLRVNVANDALGGGAIFNDSGSPLVLTRCTFFWKRLTDAAGERIYNRGTATLTNCTLGS